MGERANIAKIAERVFDDIFAIFGWKQDGPTNEDWSCVNDDHGRATHPSDVVYYYDDPYSGYRILVNTDLKSYAANTLQKSDLSPAIRSLCRATECANISPRWSELYAHNDKLWKAVGLLFVYNHDGQFLAQRFAQTLNSLNDEVFSILPGNKAFIFGPDTVNLLASVATDIRRLQGEGKLPKKLAFYYPDRIGPRTRAKHWESATLEVLTGPWLIIQAEPDKHDKMGSVEKRYILYYLAKTAEVDDMKYLLDALFRFQLIDNTTEIDVRLATFIADSALHFEKAKRDIAEFIHSRYQTDEFESRLAKVTFSQSNISTTWYDQTQIGLTRG